MTPAEKYAAMRITDGNPNHNRLISPYEAIINGKESGLSGCDFPPHCERECLRKDQRLKCRGNHYEDDQGSCRYWIPIIPVRLN